MTGSKNMTKSKAYRGEEDAIITKLDLMKLCKKEINKWKRIIRNREFPTNLKMQKEAALIARGIYIKYQSIKAINDHKEDKIDDFIESISTMAGKYENLFSGQSVKISMEDGEGNPQAPILNLVSFKDMVQKKPEND